MQAKSHQSRHQYLTFDIVFVAWDFYTQKSWLPWSYGLCWNDKPPLHLLGLNYHATTNLWSMSSEEPTYPVFISSYFDMTRIWPDTRKAYLDTECHLVYDNWLLFSKGFGFVLLLRTWYLLGNLADVCKDLHQKQSWCIQMHPGIFCFLLFSVEEITGV